jgi:hypothetical protein
MHKAKLKRTWGGEKVEDGLKDGEREMGRGN